jgi:ribosomal protein S18 acetylase RimI-like enzyme
MEGVRPATLDDLGDCTDLLGLLFAQEREFSPDPSLQTIGLEMILADSETGAVFVYESEGVIRGMVILLFTVSTALGKRVAILEDLIVSPGARGRSIGRRLVEYALKFARSNGFARITLLADSDNEPAHNLYRTCGFAESEMIVFRKVIQAEDTASQEVSIILP